MSESTPAPQTLSESLREKLEEEIYRDGNPAPVQATTEENRFRTIVVEDVLKTTVYVVAEKVSMITSEYDRIRGERVTTIFLDNGSRVQTLASAEGVVDQLLGLTP